MKLDTGAGVYFVKEPAKGRRRPMMDMFGMIAQGEDMFATRQISQLEPWLPWHGQDQSAVHDSEEFPDGTFGIFQVLQHFQTQRDMMTAVFHGQGEDVSRLETAEWVSDTA